MKKLQKNSEFFARAAQKYYGLKAEEYAKIDERKWKTPAAKALLLEKLCAEMKPAAVLELGTGTGRYFPFLSGTRYVGIDICDSMLAHARTRLNILKEKGFRETALIQGDVPSFLSAECQPGEFDFIFSIGCIGHHIPLTVSLLSDIYKALKPGGTVYLQTTQASLMWKIRRMVRHWRNCVLGLDDDHGFLCTTTAGQIKKIALSAGFAVEWTRDEDVRWNNRPMLLTLLKKAAQ